MRWLDGMTNLLGMSLSKLGVGYGQGSLACCSLWGHKESDKTEPLNRTDYLLPYRSLTHSFFIFGQFKTKCMSPFKEKSDLEK